MFLYCFVLYGRSQLYLAFLPHFAPLLYRTPSPGVYRDSIVRLAHCNKVLEQVRNLTKPRPRMRPEEREHYIEEENYVRARNMKCASNPITYRLYQNDESGYLACERD
jgi:hypothetical protein